MVCVVFANSTVTTWSLLSLKPKTSSSSPVKDFWTQASRGVGEITVSSSPGPTCST